MFGLPGGEILDFMDAARRAGIEFLLTRHEATASFMADVTGQISRVPGVCVATLGPGAVNMTLGVANAFLDRSPLIAITAAHALGAAPYATHQKLDLNAVYRPFTKLAITLDGRDTAAKVQARNPGEPRAADGARAHRAAERRRQAPRNASGGWSCRGPSLSSGRAGRHPPRRSISWRRRSAAPAGRSPSSGSTSIPAVDAPAVREFVEALGLPMFVTPKAKGMLPEDHPLFYGVCAGVSGDAVVLDLFSRADLLVGIGFEPVESDKLWHHTMPLVSIGPVSIAADEYRPHAEAVGDVPARWPRCAPAPLGPFDWTADDRDRFRQELERVLRAGIASGGLSGYELTRRLRELVPRDTIFTTDVGVGQDGHEPGLDDVRAADVLRVERAVGDELQPSGRDGRAAAAPDPPILCTIGDGGFGMTLREIETCVRERLHFVTVVYNDSSLSLIDVAQQRRGQPTQRCALRLRRFCRRVRSAGRLGPAGRDDGAAGRARCVKRCGSIVRPSSTRSSIRPSTSRRRPRRRGGASAPLSWLEAGQREAGSWQLDSFIHTEAPASDGRARRGTRECSRPPKATIVSSTTERLITIGSWPLSSKSSDSAPFQGSSAPTMPITPPMSVIHPTCFRIIRRIRAPSAPSAMRRPISRVRCDTV